jgi:dTDP-4-amino-4,6-dideoxygalactose transaminase
VSVVSVPFLRLRPAEDAPAVDAAIRRVLDRGWFVLGSEVDAFEREFALACGCAHAVGTGTDAIALILRALGIGAGDEVITAPISAAYTARTPGDVRGAPRRHGRNRGRLQLLPDQESGGPGRRGRGRHRRSWPCGTHPAPAQRPADCPAAARACREVLSLPLHPGMVDEDVHAVARAVRAFA